MPSKLVVVLLVVI